MRMTVKVKLAAAFGIIVFLTGVIGVVGYEKLSAMNATIAEIVGKDVQIQRLAQDLSVHLLESIRSEKGSIISSDDAEMASFKKDAQSERLAMHDDITKLEALATGATLDLVAKSKTILGRFEPIQDKVIGFALMNSNYSAHFASMKVMDAKDKAVASLRDLIKASRDPEVTRSLALLDAAYYELWSDTQVAITAPSVSDLTDVNKRIEGDKAQANQALADTRVLLADASATRIDAKTSAKELAALENVAGLLKDNDGVVSINSGAGNIQAGDLSSGDGAKLSNELIGSINELVKLVGSQLEADRVSAEGSYMHSRLLFIAITMAAIVIAIGSGLWIALSIGWGLGRARNLAEAVAIGDLGHTIEIMANDEIGDLVHALNGMVVSLKSSARVAESIASGDLTIETKRLSNQDTLGIALERMLSKLRDIVAGSIAASDNVSSSSPGTRGQRRRIVAGRYRAGLRCGTGVGLDGADGGEREAKCRQRQPDRDDRTPIVPRCGGDRPCRRWCGDGDGGDRRKDIDRSGDRTPDRSARPQRRRRSGTGGRTRTGLRGRCL